MILFKFLLSVVIAAVLGWAANPDDASGQTMYVTSPACGHWRCVVTWKHGDEVTVNWLNPPNGAKYVSIQLASNIGKPTYNITSKYPAVTDSCDTQGQGGKCGSYNFTVPNDWVNAANYTVIVTPKGLPNLAGYTDAVTISGARNLTMGRKTLVGGHHESSATDETASASSGSSSSAPSAEATKSSNKLVHEASSASRMSVALPVLAFIPVLLFSLV